MGKSFTVVTRRRHRRARGVSAMSRCSPPDTHWTRQIEAQRTAPWSSVRDEHRGELSQEGTDHEHRGAHERHDGSHRCAPSVVARGRNVAVSARGSASSARASEIERATMSTAARAAACAPSGPNDGDTEGRRQHLRVVVPVTPPRRRHPRPATPRSRACPYRWPPGGTRLPSGSQGSRRCRTYPPTARARREMVREPVQRLGRFGNRLAAVGERAVDVEHEVHEREVVGSGDPNAQHQRLSTRPHAARRPTGLLEARRRSPVT